MTASVVDFILMFLFLTSKVRSMQVPYAVKKYLWDRLVRVSIESEFIQLKNGEKWF